MEKSLIEQEEETAQKRRYLLRKGWVGKRESTQPDRGGDERKMRGKSWETRFEGRGAGK